MFVPKASARYCTHLSRAQAEEATEFHGAVLISIRDFRSATPRLRREAWHDVLLLAFDDLDCTDEDLGMYVGSGYVPATQEHAEAIVGFARRHFRRSIIAHCEMGRHRSAGVCWFLTEQGWRYSSVGKGLSAANRRVIRLLQAELERIGGRLNP